MRYHKCTLFPSHLYQICTEKKTINKKWPSHSLIEKGPVEDIVNECN